MKIYLAGPMTGHPNLNYPAFLEAAMYLREQGHEVFSPAEADVERHGPEIMHPFGDADAHPDFSLREALKIDLTWICEHAEGIALLPGWERSKGARTEKALADALDLAVIHL